MVARAVAEVVAEAALAAEAVEVAVEVVVVMAVARIQTTCQETSGMPSVLKSNRPSVMLGAQLVLGPSKVAAIDSDSGGNKKAAHQEENRTGDSMTRRVSRMSSAIDDDGFDEDPPELAI